MKKVKIALNWLGINEYDIIQHKNYDNPIQVIENVADLLGIDLEEIYNTDPVNRIHELEDGPRKCFVWDTEMTDQQIIEFTSQVRTEFIKKYSRDPQALHFIRNDINDITELDPEVVREKVEPWLNNSSGGGE